MTTRIDGLLAANARYVPEHLELGDGRPTERLAVLTCMDARIDAFAVLGLHLGQAHVLRNAGGRVTDDVRRSLALSTHILGVDALVVLQHTRCGLVGVDENELRETTGRDLGFLPIADHTAALRADIDEIIATPYLDRLELIGGMVYDVATGHVEDVVRWTRPA